MTQIEIWLCYIIQDVFIYVNHLRNGDKVCQWFSQSTLVSSINKTDCHDITEILLKVALNTINTNPALLAYLPTLFFKIVCGNIWIYLKTLQHVFLIWHFNEIMILNFLFFLESEMWKKTSNDINMLLILFIKTILHLQSSKYWNIFLAHLAICHVSFCHG